MENKNIDFKGTGKLFLEIRREVLPGDEDLECQACGKTNLKYYWKFGMVSITSRSRHICDDCHSILTK
jgi:hypothetical protein